MDLNADLPQGDAPSDDDSPPEMRIAREIVDLHRFFESWLTGELENSEENFARFSGVMAEGFEIVNPGGRRISRRDLLSELHRAHGTRPAHGFRIWIENTSSRRVGVGLHLVTYEEWQESGGVKRGRLSTALLRERVGTPRNLEWLHVHEVWLP